VNVLGIEIDSKVTEAGRRYLGLDDNPRVRVATADGRVYLATHDRRFDAIFLDAFRQPYIPFYLTTREFWKLAAERLRGGGMVMANVGTVPGDDRLPDAIAGTMATEFTSVYRWPAGEFNVIVAGSRAAEPDRRRAVRAGGRRRPCTGRPPGRAERRSAHRRPGAGGVDDGSDDRPLRRGRRHRQVGLGDTLRSWPGR
jgi:hypothetical protein